MADINWVEKDLIDRLQARAEKAEARNAELETLWCVQIIGPDTVHPTYSKREAEERAAKINATILAVCGGSAVLSAVAAKWPWSAESHRPIDVDWNGDLC